MSQIIRLCDTFFANNHLFSVTFLRLQSNPFCIEKPLYADLNSFLPKGVFLSFIFRLSFLLLVFFTSFQTQNQHGQQGDGCHSGDGDGSGDMSGALGVFIPFCA